MELKKANNQRTYAIKKHFERGEKKQREQRKQKELMDLSYFKQMSAQELLNFLEYKYDKVANGTIPTKLIVSIRQRIKVLESEFKNFYKDMLNDYLVKIGGKAMTDQQYKLHYLKYHFSIFMPHGRDNNCCWFSINGFNFIRIKSEIHSAQKFQMKEIPHVQFETSFGEILDMKRFKRDVIQELQRFISYQKGLEQIKF